MDRFLYIKIVEHQLKSSVNRLYERIDVVWRDDADSIHHSWYELDKIHGICSTAGKMIDIWLITKV